jgi:hypothetical protein
MEMNPVFFSVKLNWFVVSNFCTNVSKQNYIRCYAILFSVGACIDRDVATDALNCYYNPVLISSFYICTLPLCLGDSLERRNHWLIYHVFECLVILVPWEHFGSYLIFTLEHLCYGLIFTLEMKSSVLSSNPNLYLSEFVTLPPLKLVI